NFNRGQRDLRLFELGKIYPCGKDEQKKLGILLSGKRRDDWRDRKTGNVDFYDLKGVVEQLLHSLCIEDVVFDQGVCDALVNGQTAVLKKGKTTIGHIGAIRKDV